MKFGQSRTKETMYKQWMKQGATSPAAHPQERSPALTGMHNRRRLRILYILLGLSICVLGAGLVLLIII